MSDPTAGPTVVRHGPPDAVDPEPSAPDSFTLTLRHLWLLVPFALAAWVIGGPIADNSFLWHVRAGTAQLDRGRVLTADPFSFTAAGEPWRTQSWLVEAGYGLLERVTGGLGWVPWMTFVVVALTLGAVGLALYASSRRRIVPVVIGIFVVAWQGAPFWVPRPVVFGYMGLALTVVMLQDTRRRDLALILPGMIWVWAAVHGSFVLGIGLVTLEAIRSRSRRLGLLAGASVVLASLTAHGLGVWRILIEFLRSREALDLISEWRPPDFSGAMAFPFVLALIATVVAAASGTVRRRDLVVVVPWMLFGLLATRNLYPAVIVLAPYAVRALPHRTEATRRDSQLVNYAFVAAMAVFAFMGLSRPAVVDETRYPPGIVEALEQGPVFHSDSFGGYLIYSQWPGRLVFVDDRAELYGAERFREFHRLRQGFGYEDVFATHAIEQAVVETDWPLLADLLEDGWSQRWADTNLVLLTAP